MKIIKIVFGFIFGALLALVLKYAYLGAGAFFGKIKRDYAEYYDPVEDKHKVDTFVSLFKFIDYDHVCNDMMHDAKENWKWGFGIK